MSNRSTRNRDRHRRIIAATRPPCALCGEPIDYTLNFLTGQHGAKCRKPNCTGCVPHPRRFEADHKKPLKLGGTDDLTNKQATHRECNSRKRARAESPIVKRSGSLTS